MVKSLLCLTYGIIIKKIIIKLVLKPNIYKKRSFGCILFELIELNRAYNQENEYDIMNAIIKGQIPEVDSDENGFNLILKRFKFVFVKL